MIEVKLEISQREKHLTGLAFRRPQIHPDETIPVGDVRMRLFFESRGAVLVDQMLSRGRGERHDSLGEERRRGEVDLARCCGQELRILVPEGLFGSRDEELHLGDSDFARDEVSTEGAEDGDVLPVVVPELGLVGGFGEFDGDCSAAVAGVDGAAGAGADLAEGGFVGFWSGGGGGRRGWGVEREEVVELLVQVGGWGGGHGCCCWMLLFEVLVENRFLCGRFRWSYMQGKKWQSRGSCDCRRAL